MGSSKVALILSKTIRTKMLLQLNIANLLRILLKSTLKARGTTRYEK